MFVLTMDQRGSRTQGDRVPQLLDILTPFQTVLSFERSVGDEVQALLEKPEIVVEVVCRVLREKDWYIGIGIGEVELPLPQSSRAAAGDAFIAAREAVEAAKKSGERVPVQVRSALHESTPWATAAEAVLVLLGDVVRRRSVAEWRVLDALDAHPDASQRDIAGQLKITPQAVSKTIFRAGRQEEKQGRHAATLLLQTANNTTGISPAQNVGPAS